MATKNQKTRARSLLNEAFRLFRDDPTAGAHCALDTAMEAWRATCRDDPALDRKLAGASCALGAVRELRRQKTATGGAS